MAWLKAEIMEAEEMVDYVGERRDSCGGDGSQKGIESRGQLKGVEEDNQHGNQ